MDPSRIAVNLSVAIAVLTLTGCSPPVGEQQSNASMPSFHYLSLYSLQSRYTVSAEISDGGLLLYSIKTPDPNVGGGITVFLNPRSPGSTLAFWQRNGFGTTAAEFAAMKPYDALHLPGCEVRYELIPQYEIAPERTPQIIPEHISLLAQCEDEKALVQFGAYNATENNTPPTALMQDIYDALTQAPDPALAADPYSCTKDSDCHLYIVIPVCTAKAANVYAGFSENIPYPPSAAGNSCAFGEMKAACRAQRCVEEVDCAFFHKEYYDEAYWDEQCTPENLKYDSENNVMHPGMLNRSCSRYRECPGAS